MMVAEYLNATGTCLLYQDKSIILPYTIYLVNVSYDVITIVATERPCE